MLPKQLESIYDLLEQYECEDIVLTRPGSTVVGNHLRGQFLLTLTRRNIGYHWTDHALTRLYARAVTEIAGTVPHDDQPDGVRPQIPGRPDSDRG